MLAWVFLFPVREPCSLADMKNNHAMASIENDFNYFSRYGPSYLKSENVSLAPLGNTKLPPKSKMAAEIGKFAGFIFLKKVVLKR